MDERQTESCIDGTRVTVRGAKMNRKILCSVHESRNPTVVAGALTVLLLMVACSGTTVHPVAVESAPPDGAPDAPAQPPVAVSGAALYEGDAEALARGRGLFRAVCTGYCHATRPADRIAPDLFDCDWPKGDADSDIFQIITDGVADTQMLGFRGKLPDEDLWKIVAYIRTESRCSEGAG